MRIRSIYGDPNARHTWVVDEINQSGRDTYTVFCVERREYADNLRGSGGKPDLSAELLELARRGAETIADHRHRRKYRHYQP